MFGDSKYEMKIIIITLLIWEGSQLVLASEGDRSTLYQKCNKICIDKNCTQDGVGFTEKAAELQDGWSRLLWWNCRDECQYHCMWRTVKAYRESLGYIPKFHGKWPFTRIAGIQEPASALSSLLNLATNIYMYKSLTREFPMGNTPLVFFWKLFAFVCMNAWVWSTIFHTRDNMLTEFMDYACALSMVMGLFVAAVTRLLQKRRKISACILMVTLLYYVQHVQYLYTGLVDYDFNMKVNIFFGVVGSVIWLVWSIFQYFAGRVYTWRMIAFTILSGAALSLELFDFPPKYDAWDAHALWHLSTAPLPLLFYKFVIDDLRHIQAGRADKTTKLP